ncbi:aminopeptidase N [Mucilaginibacter yixingensis]|uniref:Aminopeptidase N n=1 Tax=Mucilaginibacter yixingensis TaxID=1295612 RepID=A0A2T5JEQ4_9SPHI|nr:M1 family metallopeptidase [Mucilaginibacter yixingensis]PTR00885.1 aminopeptidase N [Mucilaginibacter yixingensis]
MRKFSAALLSITLLTATAFTHKAVAQTDTAALKIYRATPTKINDLVNTKLAVSFDYKKCYLYGKEWVTLKPHFYPTDSLRLDAKGMDIKTIAVVQNGKNIPLKYAYEDSLSLNIKLNKTYLNNESYTIYIDYTSKPNQLKTKGSAAITDDKGLYFINPDGKDPNKPIQIWTQGESESSSAWFPTIDKPNQKTTEEIAMTVPAKYVTLSNGKLISQQPNANGTRTDTWKMDLPHSPYLFMMAVGDFKIYHDKWKNIPVDYYLEPKYAPYAKDIFGDTPEMIDFYSKTLGIDFPWNKYAQIVVRDYVSGAMENTTATLHGDYVQATKRELMDAYYNFGRQTIAHELFHQWFGDYVTTESWSNLTVNESFADFSETMWAEHKYGQDAGDAHFFKDMGEYLDDPKNADKDLVRFYYADKEDMFDYVTYKKGGCILNMLREYLGRDAFYKGLNIYLKTNAFKNGEAQQLRLALEEASGKDLNWFFNEWYYGSGHPLLDISYNWNEASKTETVTIKQKQMNKVFTLPMAIDIYGGGKKTRHDVWVADSVFTTSFKLPAKPDLVNVDAAKKTICIKADHKTDAEFVFQYFNAPLYADRAEAIEALSVHRDSKEAQKVLIAALKDRYYELQTTAIDALDLKNADIRNAAVPVLTQLAQSDPNTLVRAAAIKALIMLRDPGNMNLFKQAISNQSFAVEGAGLVGLASLDTDQAMTMAKTLETDAEGELITSIVTLYIAAGNDEQWPYINSHFDNLGTTDKFSLLRDYADFVAKLKNPIYAQQGIAEMKTMGIKYKTAGITEPLTKMLNDVKAHRQAMGDDATGKMIDEALKAIQ